MAQAISRGIIKTGVGVETINLELESTEQALEVVRASKGFVIGSPTLGGHMPTQVRCFYGVSSEQVLLVNKTRLGALL